MTFFHCKLRAVTLIEVLVTLALISAGGALSTFFGLDVHTRINTRTEIDSIMTSLIRARAASQASVCRIESCSGMKIHGATIAANQIALFEEELTGERTIYERIPLSGDLFLNPVTIRFLPLSSKSDWLTTIPIHDSIGNNWILSITANGMIGFKGEESAPVL